MTGKNITVQVAESILREKFAPWIQELNIGVESIADGEAVVRVPVSARLNREGGTICGQAIMAVADTVTVLAISSIHGGFVPMTTISQTSSFLRPVADKDLIAHARIIKSGRVIVYGEVSLYTDMPDKPVAHITSTYMLL